MLTRLECFYPIKAKHSIAITSIMKTSTKTLWKHDTGTTAKVAPQAA